MQKDEDAAKRRLLAQAQAGDDQAMEELLKSMQPRLYRFSMKVCRHNEDAQDVLQDTLLLIARSLRQFRGTSSLSTWAYTIARNLCIKKRRKSRFAPKVEESLDGLAPHERSALATGDPDPQKSAESAQLMGRINTAIAALPHEQREVLVLRDVEGLRAQEVAQITELSVAAVKSRLHRARAQLREFLSDGNDERGPDCPDIRQVFSEHLEGDLSASVCAIMEAHVAQCPSCAAQCDGLKEALGACSSAPSEVPEAVQAQVRAALRTALAQLPR